ncbi:DUF1287 domain-containing protein [Thalassotalea sp. PS06]|uniref:DUF1287 domain-containing protein n=1 Tax=Thalassotalea sp. PS06 TaxID=2594005 RepID=UPI001163917D|nr:DUF1287 domain-containing protein [Thalassotalea sp. PS06]
MVIKHALLSILCASTLALPLSSMAESFSDKLTDAALLRTQASVTYDGRYLAIAYPNGDVPANIGVCTDVVIRSYRTLGIDLQQLVHEDIRENFSAYPSKRIWGLTRPDTNIDHRRVPNLQAFFRRHGETLTISNQASDYQPGELVTWMLPGNLPHIGIVSDQRSAISGNPLIIHNIGSGPEISDMLFSFEITGRYRYWPEKSVE